MPARSLLLTALLLASSCGWVSGCSSKASDGPARRVILISCDTLRADHLGHYGYGRDVSPNLDAFARGALIFEEAYSTAPMTQPAVSSMFTGKLPLEIGVTFDNHLMMPPEVETLAEVLGEHGVRTGAVVSNFVLRRPRTAGHGAGVHQGFAYYNDEMTEKEQNRVHFERLAPDTSAAAIEWLEARDSDEAFFFWVHYQDPHGPYTPPTEFLLDPSGDAHEEQIATSGSRYGKGGIPEYQLIANRREPSFYRDLYDAEIRFFDHEVGKLLDCLRANDLYDGSLIIFTADHGESLGEHDYWFCHGENLHREVVRVPLVVRYVDGMQPPMSTERDGYRRSERVASHLDLWSTVLEAFGIDAPPSRGTSLLGELPEERLVGHLLYPEQDQPRWWGASDGRFRVLYDSVNQMRLYDVKNDPGETEDLGQRDPQRMLDMANRFQSTLEGLKKEELPVGVKMKNDAETEQALLQLGYTDGRR